MGDDALKKKIKKYYNKRSTYSHGTENSRMHSGGRFVLLSSDGFRGGGGNGAGRSDGVFPQLECVFRQRESGEEPSLGKA